MNQAMRAIVIRERIFGMMLIHVFRVLGQVSFVLLGDSRAKVENEEIEGVVRSGLLEVNECVDRWIGLCFERELVSGW